MRCSLYIHIPFCRSKCRYCDFFSLSGRDELIDGYLDALAEEWRLHEHSGFYEFTTVYIGGGTPSTVVFSVTLPISTPSPKSTSCSAPSAVS